MGYPLTPPLGTLAAGRPTHLPPPPFPPSRPLKVFAHGWGIEFEQAAPFGPAPCLYVPITPPKPPFPDPAAKAKTSVHPLVLSMAEEIEEFWQTIPQVQQMDIPEGMAMIEASYEDEGALNGLYLKNVVCAYMSTSDWWGGVRHPRGVR